LLVEAQSASLVSKSYIAKGADVDAGDDAPLHATDFSGYKVVADLKIVAVAN